MGFQEEEERPRPDFAAKAPYLEKNPVTFIDKFILVIRLFPFHRPFIKMSKRRILNQYSNERDILFNRIRGIFSLRNQKSGSQTFKKLADSR